MQGQVGPYDAFFRIQQLYRALKQQDAQHYAEKRQFVLKLQEMRQNADREIAAMQQYYSKCMLHLVSNNPLPERPAVRQLSADELRANAEASALSAENLKKYLELLRYERDDLSKMCHQFAMQGYLPAAYPDKSAKPHRQFLRENMPVQTKMTGDELDFRLIHVTTREDFQEYKLTRNPINNECAAYEQNTTAAYLEEQKPAHGDLSTLPFLSKSMASQKLYQSETIRLRNRCDAMRASVRDLNERFSRVQAAIRYRWPDAAHELGLMSNAFREFWYQFDK